MSSASTNASVAQVTATADEHYVPELEIRPLKGWIPVDWSELFRFRELLYFLIWRDIKVRYKQAILGSAWAVLQPVLSAVIFTLIFGMGFKLRDGIPADVPYFIYAFTALIPWQFFNSAVSIGGSALVNQQHLLTKIYFPRLFLPTASVGAGLLDAAIAFAMLLIMMGIRGVSPSWGVLMVPLLSLLLVVFTLGLVYLLSALTVIYRDFKFITPFMLQIMSYASFVQYPAEGILRNHPGVSYFLMLNPMFGIVNAFRAAVLGRSIEWRWDHLVTSGIASIALFLLGLFYFRKTERRFADIA